VQELQREEARVEAQSLELKKELGLTDLTLTQILFIVGLPWVGVAAKQGPSHVILWMLAVALFYVPSAVVVTHLNRVMPLEGGLYQWAKLGINELIGFLVAWNLWLFAILNTSEIGLQVTQYIGYIVGPAGESLTSNRAFVAGTSFILIAGLVLLTIVGFSAGKWLHKVGGALMLVTFGVLLVLPFLLKAFGRIPAYNPLQTELPVLSLMSFNLLGKMGFGAFGGFEYVAIHAGECKDPVRSIGRSVAIAAPVITIMFILGTSSVLAIVPVAQIDLIAPVPQVLNRGLNLLGVAYGIAPIVISTLLVIRVAQSSVLFGGTSRLPMVAGWDHLLPEWFTRLHSERKTPVNSVIFVGAVTFGFSVIGIIGVGKQEAFQLLWNSSGVFYALTYVAMFAIPVFGVRSVRDQVPLWLKVCSISGLVMTLLFVALSVMPIIRVESQVAFAIKIGLLIIATNAIGILLFMIAERKRRQALRV
jgi:glutamate:GABA antiporter